MSNLKKSNRPLIIMLSVSIFPIIAAYFIFFTGFGMPDNTVNAGQLITKAQPLQPLLNNADWQALDENKKWRLLLPIKNNCTSSCEKNLYTSRQVHIRLDQKSERLQRIGLVTESLDSESKSWLEKEHPRLKLIQSEQQVTENWLNAIPELQSYGEDFYILVDQEGRAMMVYSSETHGNDVLKDIKRALKYSIDYQS